MLGGEKIFDISYQISYRDDLPSLLPQASHQDMYMGYSGLIIGSFGFAIWSGHFHSQTMDCLIFSNAKILNKEKYY
jgi:hypothetical protein